MIHQRKVDNALAALNAVLVIVRKLAYDERPHNQIADALDAAEYLPRLMADQEDKTDEFRDVLVGLTMLDDAFHIALWRFDSEKLEPW